MLAYTITYGYTKNLKTDIHVRNAPITYMY